MRACRSHWIVLIGLLILRSTIGQNLSSAHFNGTVQTEWDKDGRHMTLLKDFQFVDSNGVVWDAPPGSVIDGASIPKFAWSIIGGPFEGLYRDASVIHDVACDKKDRPWAEVHKAFYNAMVTSKVDTVKAKVMYAAVYYFGPRWPLTITTTKTSAVGETEQGVSETGVNDPNVAKIINESGPDNTVATQITGKGSGTKPHVPQTIESVTITPKQPALSEDDFKQLESEIEKRENTKPGGMTLEEIRNYHVVAQSTTNVYGTQQADHGIINNGSNLGTQTVQDNRQYGVPKPPPNVIIDSSAPLAPLPPPNPGQAQMELGPITNPGLHISFHVDSIFLRPMFLVHCNHPCVATSIMFAKNGFGSFAGRKQENLLATEDPRVVLFGSGQAPNVTPDVTVMVTVRSQDSQPVDSATVECYIE